MKEAAFVSGKEAAFVSGKEARFVSGHDFSRAVKGCKARGFNPRIKPPKLTRALVPEAKPRSFGIFHRKA